MNKEIICAGFGGQGVLTAGLILAEAGFRKGQNLTWYPSYGSEMRGGTANCNVKLSDEEIGSPYCNELDILLAMNAPSVERFEHMIKPGGILLYNRDMVEADKITRQDITALSVPANELSAGAENSKGANLVMLGVLEKATGMFGKEELAAAIAAYFDKKGKGKYLSANIAAFDAGYRLYS